MTKRDYAMLGKDAEQAVNSGLATAQWYQTNIPRKTMKGLMKRNNFPAIRDTIILFTAMIVLASIGTYLLPSLWSIPVWLAYGVLYGSAMDSRWHECSHGTPFRTGWMNDVIYQIASFCMIRNPITWRWGHARHHTDTIIVGRDPEIVAMRPPQLRVIVLNLFGVYDVPKSLWRMMQDAAGYLNEEEMSYIPQSERYKVARIARIWVLIYAAVISLAFSLNSIVPLLIIGLPRMYGAWHHILTGVLQHAALADNVIDHRLNSRTVYMNPISRFIYWNMNYHIEHHMYPMVPYHQLPKLHALLKDDCPTPNTSIWQAYSEAIPVLRKQLKNENYFLTRELPKTASPYLEFDLIGNLSTTNK